MFVELADQYTTTSGTIGLCAVNDTYIELTSYTPLPGEQWTSLINQNYYPDIYGPANGIRNVSECVVNLLTVLPNNHHHGGGVQGGLVSVASLTITVTSRVDPLSTSSRSSAKFIAASATNPTPAVPTMPQAAPPYHIESHPTPSVTTMKPITVPFSHPLPSGIATEGGDGDTESKSDSRNPVKSGPIMVQESESPLSPSDQSIGAHILHQSSVTESFSIPLSSTPTALTLIIGTQSTGPGGSAVTISGTPISLDLQATALYIGSSALLIRPVPFVSTLASATITVDPVEPIVIGTQTLVPGGSAIIISNTPVSLAAETLGHQLGLPGLPIYVPPVLTLAGSVYTETPTVGFVIGSQTLLPGGPVITVDSTPLSLALGATEIVVGSVTSVLRSISAPEALTLAGSVYTETPTVGFVIGSQTLVPGGPIIIVNGTPLSLAPGATEIIIGSAAKSIPSTPTLGGLVGSDFTSGIGTAETTAVVTDMKPAGSTSFATKEYGTGRYSWIVAEAIVLASAMAVIFIL